MKLPESVLISRTDSIGDVVLALPVAGMLKKTFPGIKIGLLANQYTKAIAEACEYIDEFIDVNIFFKDDVFIIGKLPEVILHLKTNPEVARRAKELKIPIRIGTMSRLYHWFYCNKLVWLSRKKTGLHEAQSNLKLLKPFGIKATVSFEEMYNLYGLTQLEPLSDEFRIMISKDKVNVIMHPKSRGNAREWPAAHFIELINSLNPEVHQVFLSGVESEKKDLHQIADAVNKPVTNLAGQIPLAQFISFISAADAVISNSTGPVHIAAALGKYTIGIYPSLPRKDAQRWGPIGVNAKAIEFKKFCTECINTPDKCNCMNAIQPAQIKAELNKIAKEIKT